MVLGCCHPGRLRQPSHHRVKGPRSQGKREGRGLSLPPLKPTELALDPRFQIPHSATAPLGHKHLPSLLSEHPQKVQLIGAFQILQVINSIYILSVLTVLPFPEPELQFPLSIEYPFLINCTLANLHCFLFFCFALFFS